MTAMDDDAFMEAASLLFEACLSARDALECNCGGPCLGTCSHALVERALRVALGKEGGSVMRKGNERPMVVVCRNCGHIPADNVKTLNIEEDIQGRDVVTFTCKTCNETQKSFVLC